MLDKGDDWTRDWCPLSNGWLARRLHVQPPPVREVLYLPDSPSPGHFRSGAWEISDASPVPEHAPRILTAARL